MNVIETLLKSSRALTTRERREHKVLPGQWEETLAKHARMRSSIAEMKKHEETQRFLTLLTQFPLLNTAPLTEMQEVRFLGHSVELPLYGVLPFGKDGFKKDGFEVAIRQFLFGYWEESSCGGRPTWSKITMKHESIRIADWEWSRGRHTGYALPALTSKFLELIQANFRDLFLRLGYRSYDDVRLSAVTQCPKPPKRISRAASDALEYGFTGLSVVWGPAKWVVQEKCAPEDDPLLVGRLFDRWWILDQWDPTDAEKRLVNTP